MPPKLPADHPVEGPKMQPTPEERAELVEGRERESEEERQAERREEAREETRDEATNERSVLQELSAAASALVPEAGVGEGPGAGGRRNLVYLLLFIALIAAAVLIFLYAT